jgi:deazaflavin-dependent oxidoreductase (nitroreductase family)
MPLEGEYEPSAWDWVRDQVEAIESSGGTEGLGFADTGLPVVIVTTVGNKTGKLRKNPVMRVEHEGRYVAIGSVGGMPKDPVWVHNIRANPHVELQDGTQKWDMVAREITGEEKAEWWKRAVAAYPDYDVYQAATERVIPVFLLERA